MDKKERNIIITPQLEIDENVMRYENSVVQMSNVARCETAPIPKKEYPIWALMGVTFGVMLMLFKIFAIAMCAIAVFGSILIYIAWQNQDTGTYLIFELNSGNVLFFSCQDKAFLKKAQKAIVECFNDRGISYEINFQDCTINDSQIGHHNEVNK